MFCRMLFAQWNRSDLPTDVTHARRSKECDRKMAKLASSLNGLATQTTILEYPGRLGPGPRARLC